MLFYCTGPLLGNQIPVIQWQLDGDVVVEKDTSVVPQFREGLWEVGGGGTWDEIFIHPKLTSLWPA